MIRKSFGKLVSYMLLFVFMFNITAPIVSANDIQQTRASGIMSIQGTSGNVGDTVTVNVTVESGSGSIGSVEGHLNYDPSSLEYVGGENTSGGFGDVVFVGVSDSDMNPILSFDVSFRILSPGTHSISGSASAYDFDESAYTVSGLGIIVGKENMKPIPGNCMEISNVTGNVGDTVTVNVIVESGSGSIGSVEGHLNYDPSSLEYVGGENTSGGFGNVVFVDVSDSDMNPSLSFDVSFRILSSGKHIVSGEAKVYDFDELSYLISSNGIITGKEIPKHKVVFINRKPSTCIKRGNIEHWHCSLCGKNFTSEMCDKEIEYVGLPYANHIYTEKWLFDDNKHWYECRICGNKTDEKEHSFKWVKDREPTKDKCGIAHEECICGYKKKPIEYTKADTLVPANPVKKPENRTEKIEYKPLVIIPEALKKTKFDTVEKIKNELYSKINFSFNSENITYKIETVVYDVVLSITENGVTRLATKEEIESMDGIDVTIPYPSETNKNDYIFKVSHMITIDMNGMKTGDVEVPYVMLTDEGIKVRLTGLSPVMIAYARKADDSSDIHSSDISRNEISKNTEVNNQNSSRTPNTGDEFNGMVYILISLLSILLISKILYTKKYND